MLDTNPAYRLMMVVDIERSAGRGDVALNNNRAVLLGARSVTFSRRAVLTGRVATGRTPVTA
jgi:hypothetical protein